MMVKVVSDGTPGGTKVLVDGEPINEITGIRFSINTRDIGRVGLDLDLVARDVELQGEASIFLKGRKISRVIYADGGEEEF